MLAVEARGWVALSHLSDKNKDVAKVGHPKSVIAGLRLAEANLEGR